MKEQTWHLADEMKTTLLDVKGEVSVDILFSLLSLHIVLSLSVVHSAQSTLEMYWNNFSPWKSTGN